MATMKRNPNLEEINTDALFGISYMCYQTTLQKIIMIASVVLGIGINIIATLVFNININIATLLTVIPLCIGVLLGCNYNQDLSLIAYMKLIISKPSKVYYSKSPEDLEYIRKASERIKRERELEQQEFSDEEHRKTLIKLIVGMVIAVIIFVLIVIIINLVKTEEIHHTISDAVQIKDWMEC